MIRTIWVGVAAILYSSTIATAQSASLPLEQQQPAGVFRELKLQDILDKDVTIVETSGPPGTPSVKRIERVRRDSVWNGVLIGAGAGALAGFGLGRSLDSPACPRTGIECGQGAMVGAVGGAFWGAIGGWITDALIRKRETMSPAQDGGRDRSQSLSDRGLAVDSIVSDGRPTRHQFAHRAGSLNRTRSIAVRNATCGFSPCASP
jgi:hypothetical protein